MNEKNISAPAISIITPMYNSAKYVEEFLESVLNQTLQDFELIIVDDCSTDNSREVVENYVSNFFGDKASKVKLIVLEKNTGNPATPRNIGIKAARGEYLMFIDSDDAIIPTALEGLYSTAKEHDADFMSCRQFYLFYGESWKNPTKIKLRGNSLSKVVRIEDPILRYSNRGFAPMVWVCLFKREVIVKNHVEFPHIPMTEDTFFVFFALYYSKKVFRVPNLCYYYRKHPDSIQKSNIPPTKYIDIRVESVVRGLKILEEFDKEHEVFKDRPEVKYTTFKRIIRDIMSPADGRKSYEKISVQEFNEIIQESLQKINDKDFFTTFLFNYSSNQRVEIQEKNAQIKKLQEETQTLQEENKKLQ